MHPTFTVLSALFFIVYTVIFLDFLWAVIKYKKEIALIKRAFLDLETEYLALLKEYKTLESKVQDQINKDAEYGNDNTHTK